MGGAMDLVASHCTKVVITMEHTAKVRHINIYTFTHTHTHAHTHIYIYIYIYIYICGSFHIKWTKFWKGSHPTTSDCFNIFIYQLPCIWWGLAQTYFRNYTTLKCHGIPLILSLSKSHLIFSPVWTLKTFHYLA